MIAAIRFAPLPVGELTRGKALGGFGDFGQKRSHAIGQWSNACEIRNGFGAAHV
jgi:hypothetical protein